MHYMIVGVPVIKIFVPEGIHPVLKGAIKVSKDIEFRFQDFLWL